MEQNLRIRKHLEAIPAEKGCTTSQLALAWLLNQGDDIVPISGTKRVKYLEENAAAANIMLTQDELQQIEEAVPAGAFSGARYVPSAMARVNK